MAAGFVYSLDSNSLETLTDRLESTANTDFNDIPRVELYKSTIPLIKEFPGFGTGLGTFFDVFPRVQKENFPFYYANAHNDWLELLIETGAIGLTLAAAAVGIFFFSLIKIFRERRDPYVKGIGAGVLGSSAAIFTHSMVDFNFHIPANAFLFSVILGLGYSALHNQKIHDRETSFAPYRTLRTNVKIRYLCTGVLIFSAFFLGKQITYRYLAESNCPTQVNSIIKVEKNPSLERIRKALFYEPKNAECRAKIVGKYNEEKRSSQARFDKDVYTQKNIEELTKTIALNPAQADNYLLLGSEYFSSSFTAGESQAENLDRAIMAFESAVFFNPKDYKRVFSAASIWLKFASRTADNYKKELYSEKGLELLKRTLMMVPHKREEADAIARKYFNNEDVLKK